MARPYTITAIGVIPLSDNIANIIEGIRGRTVPEDSYVEIAANMGDADVSMSVTIGSDQVFPQGPVNLEAGAGVLPSVDDDNIIRTFARGGDEIIVRGQNDDAAAAAQLRVVIVVTPIDDVVLARSMREFGVASAQAASVA